jgi:hypothetical protein
MNETSLPARQAGRSEADDLFNRLFPEVIESDANTSDVVPQSTGHFLTLVHPDEEIEATLLQPEQLVPASRGTQDLNDEERFGNESPLACEPSEPLNESFESLHGLCDGHSMGVDISIRPIAEQIIDEFVTEESIPMFDVQTGEQESISDESVDHQETWKLPSPDAPAASQVPVEVPHQIGGGKLVPTKLTWRPGDPFGDSVKVRKGAFKWETMLTTACVTAACGMACIWLLRTVLA